MKTKIQNIDDLRSEILRLRIERVEKEKDLEIQINNITDRFRYPVMLLSKMNNWIGAFTGDKDKKGDWLSSSLRVGLPMLMNKFLFPQSGIIVKSLVSLLTQKASQTLNKDLFSDVLGKITSWLKPSDKMRRNSKVLPDYGIPPDSETY